MDILIKIACQNNGVAKAIPDNLGAAYLKTQMISYYSFLASGMKINNVLWSEQYMSFTLSAPQVTAALPVYVPKGVNADSQELLGVVGVDVLMSSL